MRAFHKQKCAGVASSPGLKFVWIALALHCNTEGAGCCQKLSMQGVHAARGHRLLACPRPPLNCGGAHGQLHRSVRSVTPKQRNSHVAQFQLTADTRLTKRGADLALRQMYLTQFYYAAGFGKDLKAGQLMCTKLLDTDVCVWRHPGTGHVHCFTNKCPGSGLAAIPDVNHRPQVDLSSNDPTMCACSSSNASSIAYDVPLNSTVHGEVSQARCSCKAAHCLVHLVHAAIMFWCMPLSCFAGCMQPSECHRLLADLRSSPEWAATQRWCGARDMGLYGARRFHLALLWGPRHTA